MQKTLLSEENTNEVLKVYPTLKSSKERQDLADKFNITKKQLCALYYNRTGSSRVKTKVKPESVITKVVVTETKPVDAYSSIKLDGTLVGLPTRSFKVNGIHIEI